MEPNNRKHYVDNLRWIILLVLIPYHIAQAFNVWNEPNYVFIEGNKLISSIIVFFSPFFMPVLFVLAGISTRYALKKRTYKEYIKERLKKLLVPAIFGIILLMPPMTYIADVSNYSYSGGYFRHYKVFFTKITDWTGADGGFSVGQFWFLIYLFVISLLCLGVFAIHKKMKIEMKRSTPLWALLLLWVPLPLFNDWLSIGGKSLVEFAYLFMLGYFVFTDEKLLDKVEKLRWIIFIVGFCATISDVYLFIWSDTKYHTLNTIMKYMSEWFMIISLIALARRYLNFDGKLSRYMRPRAFLIYIYHFIWVVLLEYALYSFYGKNNGVLFIGSLVLSYLMTFICCEISIRIPALCFLTGVKYKADN